MTWPGRCLRFGWVFMMACLSFGPVWLVWEKEDWQPSTFLTYLLLISVLSGTLIGFGLGLLEGLKPNLVWTRLDKVMKWWKELGGYG